MNNQNKSKVTSAGAKLPANSHGAISPSDSIRHVNRRKENASARREAISERLKYALKLCIDNMLDPSTHNSIVAEIMREDHANSLSTPLNTHTPLNATSPATRGQLRVITAAISSNPEKKTLIYNYLAEQHKQTPTELSVAEASRLINLINNPRATPKKNQKV
jgi:hypothetical protein